MVKNPKINEGFLTYECGGEGCESPDGTHSIPVEELIVHIASIAEELLFEGDPRGPNVYVVAAMFKYIVTGDSSISNIMDDPRFTDEARKLTRTLFEHYSKLQKLVDNKDTDKKAVTLLPLSGKEDKKLLN